MRYLFFLSTFLTAVNGKFIYLFSLHDKQGSTTVQRVDTSNFLVSDSLSCFVSKVLFLLFHVILRNLCSRTHRRNQRSGMFVGKCTPNMGEAQALFESHKTPLKNTQTANSYRFFEYDTKRYFDSYKQWYFVLNLQSTCETRIHDFTLTPKRHHGVL